jgi:hypothetical protein
MLKYIQFGNIMTCNELLTITIYTLFSSTLNTTPKHKEKKVQQQKL